MKNKKLSLDDLKVQSFVTDLNKPGDQTHDFKGGITGNCGSFIHITCPEPCDYNSIGDPSCDWSGCSCPTDRYNSGQGCC